MLLGYDSFHENFVLERDLFDYSGLRDEYLWKDLVDLFCISMDYKVNMIGLIWQVKIRSFLCCLLSFVFLATCSSVLLGLEG